MKLLNAARALLGTGSAVVVAANLAGTSIGFVMGILTARLLGPAARGDLAVLTYWVAVVAAMADLGISEAITLRVAKDTAQWASAAWSGAAIAGGASVIGMAVGYAILPLLLTGDQSRLVSQARLYLVFVPVAIFASIPTGVLFGLQQFRVVALIRVSAAAMALVFLGVLFAAGNREPILVAMVGLTNHLVAGVLGAIALIRRATTRPFHWQLKTQAIHGAQLQASRIVGVLAAISDRAIANISLSQAAIGAYQVTASFNYIVPVVPQAIAQVLYARLGNCAPAGRPPLIMQAFVRAVWATSACCLFGGILLPWLIPLAFGREYATAVVPTEIVLFGGVLAAGSAVLQGAARALFGIRHCLFAEVAAILSMVATSIPLTSSLGISGLAVAFVFGRGASLMWMVGASPQLFSIRRRDLLPTSTVFYSYLASDWKYVWSLGNKRPALSNRP